MTKVLPRDLTSYDLLKMLAVILMITDHVGHHFYPDEMWFRVFGRFCVPMWFFLIGYARGADISKMLVGGALIVGVSAVVAGQFILPLNILFTIMVVRVFRDKFARAAFHSAESLRGLYLILFFLTFPTAIFFEYGAMGMMLALVGYAVRNRDDIKTRIENKYITLYVFATFLAFYLWQGIVMPHVSGVQAIVFAGGIASVAVLLSRFRAAEYVDAEKIMARSFVRIIQFFGRRTLEIYVVHVVLFRLVCMYLYPESYGFLNFQIVPAGALSLFH
ncbi:MAG: TraX family protein [Alphaproteobacteria bacterium]